MSGFTPNGLVPDHFTLSEKIEDDDLQFSEKQYPELEQQPQHIRPRMTGPHRDNHHDDDDRVYANTEATPFIDTPGGHVDKNDDDDEDPRVRLRWPVILYSFCIVFLVEVAINICWPAWNALLEKGICAEIHPDLVGLLVAGDDLDARCKEADVQGRLAMYRGWSYTVDALPSKNFHSFVFLVCMHHVQLVPFVLLMMGSRELLTDKCVAILLAVPFGSLSDKWGRKPVGILAIIGVFLVTVSYEVVCTYSQRPKYNHYAVAIKSWLTD